MQPWNLKEQFLEAVKNKGGFVNCHAHFDKAFYITKDGLDKSMLDMEVKWTMSDDIKRNSSEEEIANILYQPSYISFEYLTTKNHNQHLVFFGQG